MNTLIKPERVTFSTVGGAEKTFVLSKIPAIQGREIALQYPVSAMPKIGEYAANEKLMLKLLSYVGVDIADGNILRLDTAEKINNHLPEWEDLIRLEGLMVAYNFSFFRDGGGLISLSDFAQKSLPKITEMLTGILPQSSTSD